MKHIDQSHLTIIARTHPGMTGKNNEDRFAVNAFQLNGLASTPVLLAVLCDGVGGHRAGEVAAELAVNVITHGIANSDGSKPLLALNDSIQEASQAIFAQAQTSSDKIGMSATVVCALVIGDRLYSANEGDSRLYLIRNSFIRQLSNDHTWIQEALANGLLQPDQVKGHPNAHVIRRFLGGPIPSEVDFRMRLKDGQNDEEAIATQGTPLQPGDTLLLCSDGLTDLVANDEILSTLQSLPLDQAADSLVEQACQRGGHDNITIVLAQVPPKPPAAPKRKRLFLFGLLAFILVIALVGAIFFAFNRLGQRPLGIGTPTITREAQLAGTLPAVNAPLQTSTPLAPAVFPTATTSIPIGTTGPTLTAWPTNTQAPVTLTASATQTP
jgi:protein phosphatase